MAKPVIVSATRTAIGTLGGALAQVPATKLGAIAVREAVKRAGIEPGLVEEVILGHVLPAGLGLNPARVAALEAGIPKEVGSYGVNKACGSGLKAVALAAQSIALDEADVDRRGRHGEHERRAVPPEEGALRLPHGARSAARLDDRRRAHLSDHARAHGHHRRERRREVRDLARGAGRVRGREPAEGGRGDQGRQVQGRDRPGRGRRRQEGRDRPLRHRRAPAPRHHGGGARRSCAPPSRRTAAR